MSNNRKVDKKAVMYMDMYTMEYYSTLRNNRILSLDIILNGLKRVMPGEMPERE